MSYHYSDFVPSYHVCLGLLSTLLVWICSAPRASLRLMNHTKNVVYKTPAQLCKPWHTGNYLADPDQTPNVRSASFTKKCLSTRDWDTVGYIISDFSWLGKIRHGLRDSDREREEKMWWMARQQMNKDTQKHIGVGMLVSARLDDGQVN